MKEDWPGSRWWRCDLHVHTPASGPGEFRDADSVTPEAWLHAARDAQLDAVAVTDHNTSGWIESLQQAARNVGAAPVIFPGVELTVSSVHLLVLFDPGCDAQKVTTFLGRCGVDSEQFAEPGAAASCTLAEALVQARKAGGLCIAAHANGPKGLIKELGRGSGLKKTLAHPDLYAIEGSDHDPDLLDVVQGNVEGYPALPEVRFSDAHGLQEIGRRSTWIKMTRPDIAGLRLALIDGQASVLPHQEHLDPNRHASMLLESLEIRQGRYIGRAEPFRVEWNPWLNTIIGGRGSGKSTLVEFMRLALRRDQHLPSTVRQEFEAKIRVPEDRQSPGLLTPETKISVIYYKEGNRFRLRWQPDGEESAFEICREGSWEAAEGEIEQRCPVQIYSQRQIFELASDPQALLRVVDQALEGNGWQARWREARDEYLSLRAKIREIEGRLERRATLRGELEDLESRIGLFEKAGHTEVLQQYRRRLRQKRAVEAWTEDVLGSLADQLRSWADESRAAPLDSAAFDAIRDSAMLEKAEQLHTRLQDFPARLEGMATEVQELVADWRNEAESSGWATEVQRAEDRYRDLVDRLQEEAGTDPEAYGSLIQERERLRRELENLESLRERRDGLREATRQTLERVIALRQERTRQRREFLNQVLSENSQIRIEVLPYRDRAGAVESLRDLFGTERFAKDIGESQGKSGFLGQLYQSYRTSKSGDPQRQMAVDFEGRLEDLKSALRDQAAGKGSFEDLRFRKHLQRLPPEVWDRLQVWYPEDSLEVLYRTQKQERFRPIDQASPGQKTAALLSFLLSYGTEPILLDQPEDDLDNQLIYELLVAQLREIKSKRQVIIVTHNANIVVHGNSELVVALQVRAGQTVIEERGGLQEKEVRDKICQIMEGGREAFEQRYRRILERRRYV